MYIKYRDRDDKNRIIYHYIDQIEIAKIDNYWINNELETISKARMLLKLDEKRNKDIEKEINEIEIKNLENEIVNKKENTNKTILTLKEKIEISTPKKVTEIWENKKEKKEIEKPEITETSKPKETIKTMIIFKEITETLIKKIVIGTTGQGNEYMESLMWKVNWDNVDKSRIKIETETYKVDPEISSKEETVIATLITINNIIPPQIVIPKVKTNTTIPKVITKTSITSNSKVIGKEIAIIPKEIIKNSVTFNPKVVIEKAVIGKEIANIPKEITKLSITSNPKEIAKEIVIIPKEIIKNSITSNPKEIAKEIAIIPKEIKKNSITSNPKVEIENAGSITKVETEKAVIGPLYLKENTETKENNTKKVDIETAVKKKENIEGNTENTKNNSNEIELILKLETYNNCIEIKKESNESDSNEMDENKQLKLLLTLIDDNRNQQKTFIPLKLIKSSVSYLSKKSQKKKEIILSSKNRLEEIKYYIDDYNPLIKKIISLPSDKKIEVPLKEKWELDMEKIISLDPDNKYRDYKY